MLTSDLFRTISIRNIASETNNKQCRNMALFWFSSLLRMVAIFPECNVLFIFTVSQTHKCNVLFTVAVSQIHDSCNVLFTGAVSQIHKCNVLFTVAVSQIHKCNVLFTGAVSQIHKCNVLYTVAVSQIHDSCHVLFTGAVSQIHKCNVLFTVAVSQIHDSCNVLFTGAVSQKQYVEFEDTKSEILPITVGVPQGSILGPLLFIIYIYINDFSQASSIFKFIIYADDTTRFSNLAYFGNNIETKESLINAELSNVIEWLNINKLSLNLLINLCEPFFDTTVGPRPNLARMCG